MKNVKLDFWQYKLAAIVCLAIVGCHEKPVYFDAQLERRVMFEERFRKKYHRERSDIYKSLPLKTSYDTTSLLMSHYLVNYPDPNSYADTVPLYTRKSVYPHATVFFQEYRGYTDTLEIYRDSIWFNSFRAKKLGTRTFSYKGKPVEIDKYGYWWSKPLDGHHNDLYNLFVNDSLGLVMNYMAGHLNMYLIEVNPEYKELHEQLKQDTEFLQFELESRQRQTHP